MPATTIAVRVNARWETCDRWSYTVQLESDEGFTKDAITFRTGSKMNDYAGLKREEARERALIEAVTWADFYGLQPEPFVERDDDTGAVQEPRFAMRSYGMRREIAARKGIRPGDAD